MSRELRLYERPWIILKQKHSVVLKVAPHNLAKVKKAIIKEKDSDVVYKLEHEEKKMRLGIEYNKKTWQLTLTLAPCKAISVSDL